jgi:hypothetical protein
MIKQKPPRILTFSDRVYGALLFLYPPDHRHEYGPLMSQAFHDMGRDAVQNGAFNIIKLWLSTLPDIAITTFYEHRDNKESNLMKNPMENTGLLLLAIAFVLYIIAIVVVLIEESSVGMIGLIILAGCALLFGQAIKDRLNNEEDDYYTKNVDK